MFCIFVLAGLLAQTSAGYTQFFYSGVPQPIHHHNYQPSFYQAAAAVPLTAAPITYQSFPQFPTPAYNAIPQFFPAQQSFGYHQQAFPLQFTYTSPTVQVNTPTTQRPEASNATSTPSSTTQDTQEIDEPQQDDTVITNAAFRTNPLPNVDNTIDNFRGFGYRNDYEGGSSSHFVFITGPEAYNFRMSNSQKLSSRTSASDAVDTVASNTQQEESHNIDALLRYLENPQTGIQHFYSVNNALVSRRLEDEIPALPTPLQNVQTQLPITQPISPLFPLLRSSFQLNVETSTLTNAKDEKEEQDSAASSVETKTAAAPVISSTTESTSTTTTQTSSTTAIPSSPASSTTTTTESVTSTTSATTEKSTMEPIIVE